METMPQLPKHNRLSHRRSFTDEDPMSLRLGPEFQATIDGLADEKTWLGLLRHELDMQASVLKAKMRAGLARLFSEDIVNSSCQMVYLCKMWHSPKMSDASKAFTMASVTAALAASVLVPLIDFVAHKRLEARYVAAVNEPSLRCDIPKLSPTDDDRHPVDRSYHPLNGSYQLDVSLRRILTNAEVGHSRPVHRALIASAAFYWALMAALYLFVDVECGKALPQSAWLIFTAASTVCLLLEVWCLNHVKHGYMLFMTCEYQFVLGVLFGTLGRFDTFSDVTNAMAIQKCAAEDPDNFTWFSIHRHVFYLPLDLGKLMTIGLVLIATFQALPGMVLLILRRSIPIALKMNELCVILAALGEELITETKIGEESVELTVKAGGYSAPPGRYPLSANASQAGEELLAPHPGHERGPELHTAASGPTGQAAFDGE